VPEQFTDQSVWEKGLAVLESQLGPVQTLQFMAMVSRQPFDYQHWREERFAGLDVDEILAHVRATVG
jgi:hypothetical protein